jgi:predicted nucleic acid-binding protein
MTMLLPDTNIFIDFGRDVTVRRRLEKALQNGAAFVIGPPVLNELVRGIVANGGKTFARDREVFSWLQANRFAIEELPLPFIARLMKTRPAKTSGVLRDHYALLIDMLAGAADFNDFISKAEAPGSAWTGMKNLHDVHEGQLDKELNALVDIASRRGNVALALSNMFGAPGCRPHPLLLKERFSAALEFLDSSFCKVRAGANPRKNDPGIYVDFQLLLYLGSPEITFLTNEDFSHEIRNSPQKNRIVGLDSL